MTEIVVIELYKTLELEQHKPFSRAPVIKNTTERRAAYAYFLEISPDKSFYRMSIVQIRSVPTFSQSIKILRYQEWRKYLFSPPNTE